MDEVTARWLVSPAAAEALAAAQDEPDPGSLAAASRLRAVVAPERAAAVLDQAALRRRARTKFGDRASDYFWTTAGLEQASRPAVAARRAARLAASGAEVVVDLGCGCGADAVEIALAGPAVLGVERDPVTAVLAAANLARVSSASRVEVGDAVALAPRLLADGIPVFCDPARRSASGRSWRVEDLSPPWPFVRGLLDGSRPAAVKLGPGVPTALIGDDVEAEWVSDRGDVVETALWAGPDASPGLRRAVVGAHELSRDAPLPPPPVGPVGGFVYEPNGAVIRAGLVPAVAAAVGAHRLHDEVAYLTGDAAVRTPFATTFRVLEALPFAEKALRGWVRERGIGVLEIKKRGVDVDPAVLRRRLRPKGTAQATLILTPTAGGAVALVVTRER